MYCIYFCKHRYKITLLCNKIHIVIIKRIIQKKYTFLDYKYV